MNTKKSSKDRKPFRRMGASLLTILLLPLILAVIITYVVYRVLILVTVWTLWCTRGKFVLFVYSDSPIWQEYVTDHFLLKIRDRAIVLNWSEQRKWTKWFSLSVMAFRAIGGFREFNPMTIVFRPLRFSKVFRFWKPFKDFKHGQKESLEKMEREFFALVKSIVPEKTA